MNSKFKGIFAAVWTPTDREGRLLEEVFAENIRFVQQRGVHGLMILGTTGEFPFLTQETKRVVCEKTMELAGAMPVIVNISDIRPGVAAELGRFAGRLGVAGVSILPPYFYEYRQEEIAEFLVRVGEESGAPVVLYNFPERTGNELKLETVGAVADRIPVAAIKHSGSDFEFHGELAKLGKEKEFAVLSGSDTRLAAALALGVQGCISGLANAVPEIVSAIYDSITEGQFQAATKPSEQMRALGKLMERLPVPLNVSAAMEGRGRGLGEPKSIISASTQGLYEELVSDVKGLFDTWGLAEK
jgi:4-hydroxy-tetrahydrodipicolinate synthase